MTIGQRIKAIRKQLGLSQAKLAKQVGINQSLIAQLEAGRNTGTSHVATLARALKVNAIWLQTGTGSPDLDDTSPNEIIKTYSKEIEEVIRLMESTDGRGQRKALIAVEDALDSHRAFKNSLPRAQDMDELGELSGRLALDLLPESVESEDEPNAAYRANNGVAQKDKHH